MTTKTAQKTILIALGIACFVISQYYVWQTLPALDGVRMYELEREVGLIP